MKIIISESQYKLILENEEKKDKLISIDASIFIKQYDTILKKYKSKEEDLDGIKIKGNLDLTELDTKDIQRILDEVVHITGYLDLQNTEIESLGKLESVGSYLDLSDTPIKNLGRLKEVGGYLYLRDSEVEDLKNITKVGSYLYLTGSPIGKKLEDEMSPNEIRNKYGVKGRVYI